MTALRIDDLQTAAAARIAAHGIDLRHRPMPPDTPATFDGLSIALNPLHDRESLCWYLVHSYASIAAWCLDLHGVRQMFTELRDAKCDRAADPDRLERAIARFRSFEELASCYSVSLIEDLGQQWAVRPFTIFFRADLEAMTTFHREGRAPVWRDFLARWTAEIGRDARRLNPFDPIAIPAFQIARFELQEVKQQIA